MKVLFVLLMLSNLVGLPFAFAEVPGPRSEARSEGTERRAFQNYTPTTSAGEEFWKNVQDLRTVTRREEITFMTGGLLIVAHTESSKICSKANEAFCRKIAPKIVEAWAVKYSKYGPPSQRFIELGLRGFPQVKEDDACLIEVMNRIEMWKEEFKKTKEDKKLEELKSLTGRGEQILFGLHDLISNVEESKLPKNFRCKLMYGPDAEATR